MPNLYLPVTAAIVSAIILFVYGSKRRLRIKENTIYLIMVGSILLDSCLVSLLFYNAYTNYSEVLVLLVNRVDFMSLLCWANCLFLYTYIVIHKNDKHFETMYTVAVVTTGFISAVLTGIIWTLEINVIWIDGQPATAQGPAVSFTMIACLAYVAISLVVILLNPHKANKHAIPVFVSLVMTAVIAGLFTINPYLICISMGLTIVNLIMYFTLENPDMQMLDIVNEAREEAQRANRAKTEFLSSMSHEIRTPLNAIVGLSECILQDGSLEQVREDAKVMISASDALLELVNGILDISKIEAGKMELVNKEYDLAEVASTVARIVETRIGDKPVSLHTDISTTLPGVLCGDEAKIRQIMTNLLTNAVKYTEQGRIDFTVTCANSDDISDIVIRVKDTGHGIKPEQMDDLFDKFKRLDEDRNSKIEGTGLGLAITRTFVEMMGGHIEVSSDFGKGSCFTVYVPQTIRSMDHRCAAEDKLKHSAGYSGHRIIVVDDNSVNVLVETRVLSQFGLQVDSAGSGAECLAKCAHVAYDLILMDDMMPEMSGAETMRKLREDPGFRTPVVVLTANAIEGMREKYLAEGFDEYLTKPLEKDSLIGVFDRFLNGGDQNR